MESFSHSSVSKKNYRGNGGGAGVGVGRNKTVYDDVFGGPPKFGASTLPPRLEDYTEIFQGFHASRGSSIPVLDLPPAVDDADDFWFEVQANKFDYSEVFGGFNGLDFAVTYEELFKKSNTLEDDSSDEAWTPAQSESLSDESDPYVSLEVNKQFCNADADQSFSMTEQFKLSHNNASSKSEKDVSNGMMNDSQFHDVPVSSVFDNQTLTPCEIENEEVSSQDRDFGNQLKKAQEGANEGKQLKKAQGGGTEAKQLKKSLSQPLDGEFGREKYGRDLKHLAGHHKPDSMGTRPLFSVSDISLRTEPSQLPPPSRPPPALASKKGDTGSFNSKLKTSKSYAFERMGGDSSPPYFDVEMDAGSSAAASAAAMKDAMEQAQAKLKSAKELMEKKKESLQNRSKPWMENNVKGKEGMVNKTYDRTYSFEGERMKKSHERDGATSYQVKEERQKTETTISTVRAFVEGEKNIIEVGNSVERKIVKECKSQELDETKGTGAREATDFNDTVARKQVKDVETMVPNTKSRELRRNKNANLETVEQQEDSKNVQTKEGVERDEFGERDVTVKMSHREVEHLKKPNVSQNYCDWSEREKSFLGSQLTCEIKTPSVSDENEWYENLIEIQLQDNDMKSEGTLTRVNEKVDSRNQLKTGDEGEVYHVGSAQTSELEEYDNGLQEAVEEEHEKRLKNTLEQEAKEIRRPGTSEMDMIKNEAEREHEKGESERRGEDIQWEGYAKISAKTFEQVEGDNISEVVLEQDENKSEKELEHNEKILQEELEQERDKKEAEEVLEQEENVKIQETACETEESKQKRDHAWEKEEIEKRHKLECKSEENMKWQEAQEREVREKKEEAVLEKDGIESKLEATKWEEADKKLNLNKENRSRMEEEKLEASAEAYQVEDNEFKVAGDIPCDIFHEKMEGMPETPLYQTDGNPRSQRDNQGVGAQIHDLGEEWFSSTDLNQNELQHSKTEVRMDDMTCSNHLHESAEKREGDGVIEETHMEDKRASETTSGLETANSYTHNQAGERTNVKGSQSGFAPEVSKNKSTPSQLARESIEDGGKPLPDLVEPLRNKDSTTQEVASRSVGMKDENHNKTSSVDRVKEEKLQRERDLANDRLRKIEEERERQRERELENERLRKIEEERERQIEREKDRMSVDRATLEARERAFTEARERAERAAVERATAEFRQRALAEARERLEKACAEARERSLAEKPLESRLRAERAAVEKATPEARERAERSVADKVSAPRASGTRESCLSTNLPDPRFQKVGSFSGLRFPETAAHNGGEGESPQRYKARLERHQRTADRAAKALAEKNMRDLIAQKEQAERNRLAEGLDAEVKRWSSGKQGNLRALLSTLQYILGPDSGWQPVPLTEVITTAAVKKAYRKATLYVHPDKLQQRGASIQQKYICEKVFDLLKEAWNKFNSEER